MNMRKNARLTPLGRERLARTRRTALMVRLHPAAGASRIAGAFNSQPIDGRNRSNSRLISSADRAPTARVSLWLIG